METDISKYQEGDGKSPFSSKTLGFNFIHAVLIPAVWPFIPDEFRKHDYAVPCITAWMAIGNIVLRFMTSNAIIIFRGVKHGQEKTEVQDSKKRAH